MTPSRREFLAGAGALHAREELLALAETLSAPIVKTLSGKAAVPDDSPYTTGGIGLLGTRPSEDLMSDIDTLFMVGTNFPYTKHLPPPGKVRVAQTSPASTSPVAWRTVTPHSSAPSSIARVKAAREFSNSRPLAPRCAMIEGISSRPPPSWLRSSRCP